MPLNFAKLGDLSLQFEWSEMGETPGSLVSEPFIIYDR